MRAKLRLYAVFNACVNRIGSVNPRPGSGGVVEVDRVCLCFFDLARASRLYKRLYLHLKESVISQLSGAVRDRELEVHLSLLGKYVYPIFIISLL